MLHHEYKAGYIYRLSALRVAHVTAVLTDYKTAFPVTGYEVCENIATAMAWNLDGAYLRVGRGSTAPHFDLPELPCEPVGRIPGYGDEIRDIARIEALRAAWRVVDALGGTGAPEGYTEALNAACAALVDLMVSPAKVETIKVDCIGGPAEQIHIIDSNTGTDLARDIASHVVRMLRGSEVIGVRSDGMTRDEIIIDCTTQSVEKLEQMRDFLDVQIMRAAISTAGRDK